MRPLTWSFSARVPHAPDAVFAWMSDYREDDHDRPAYRRGAGMPEKARASSRRRILSRDGDVVRLRDAWGRREATLDVTLDAARRETRVRGEHGFEATWRATPDGDGTRLEATGRLAPGGLFALLLPLFARRFRDELERDFRGHVADLEESLAEDAKAGRYPSAGSIK